MSNFNWQTWRAEAEARWRKAEGVVGRFTGAAGPTLNVPLFEDLPRALAHIARLELALEDSTSMLEAMTGTDWNEEGAVSSQIADNRHALTAPPEDMP